MDVYEALYTTRAHRRVRPDPIPERVQQRILDAAVRAPTGGNAQGWRFLLVDDPALKSRLGPVYRGCMELLWKTIYAPRVEAARARPELPESREFEKMFISRALQRSKGNVGDAAGLLGIHRNTVARKITEYRIKRSA